MRNSYGFVGNQHDLDPHLNSYGHRCPEVEVTLGKQLAFKKFFLVLGDTAGLHLHKPLDETWYDLLHHKLRHNYYNLSVVNGGIDVARHNLGVWLGRYIKPKAVILAFDWANAFYSVDYDTDEIKEADHLANLSGYHISRNAMFNELVKTMSRDIPFYQIVHEGSAPIVNGDHITNIHCDQYDDQLVAELISASIKKSQEAIAV